ncbi:MAG TPA: GNAT family N-acetyltransferase [Phycisphaerae bacterium]|nr:GNAT family N-acetyltransferase [Phycisphaerae bacterium]
MTPSLDIRSATADDLPDILRLYALPEFDDGRTLSLDEARNRFEGLRRYPDYHIYVAWQARRIVGTFALLVMEKLNHLGTPSAIVDDVIVATECRSQGIGRRMMEHAMQLARQKGCYKLALSTNVKRAEAHRFYESLGFVRHGYSYIINLD